MQVMDWSGFSGQLTKQLAFPSLVEHSIEIPTQLTLDSVEDILIESKSSFLVTITGVENARKDETMKSETIVRLLRIIIYSLQILGKAGFVGVLSQKEYNLYGLHDY
jgi:hypothetical protein